MSERFWIFDEPMKNRMPISTRKYTKNSNNEFQQMDIRKKFFRSTFPNNGLVNQTKINQYLLEQPSFTFNESNKKDKKNQNVVPMRTSMPVSYDIGEQIGKDKFLYRSSLHENGKQRVKRQYRMSIFTNETVTMRGDKSVKCECSNKTGDKDYKIKEEKIIRMVPIGKKKVFSWSRPLSQYFIGNPLVGSINDPSRISTGNIRLDASQSGLMRRSEAFAVHRSSFKNNDIRLYPSDTNRKLPFNTGKRNGWVFVTNANSRIQARPLVVPIERRLDRQFETLIGDFSSRVSVKIDVIGASKSLKGIVPLKNRSLNNGDFGDDAGMMFENNECCFIALADGAGGNRSQGIDPSIFSRNLMASCYRLLCSTSYNTRQLPQLITAAMKRIEYSNILGSATVCVVGLDRKMKILHTLNIGDSGVKIIRRDQVVFRTRKTMNGSSPCQLFLIDHSQLYKMGVAPTSFIRESEIRADSSMQSVQIEVGDIIVMSSDGLWDVIEDSTLRSISEISNALLRTALKGYYGNSRDDILIIIAQVGLE